MIQKTSYKTKDYCKVKFTVDAENAESVEILGLNGDWDTPVAMSKKKDGTFATEVQLPKNSRHEFKYRVNGSDWINEPEADEQSSNEYGGQNSVITL
ncbi:isoamylase early set domain-containing protein [Pontibacter harenae]|uniref:isoamylase early set domain-containing protein n=1 Tax=Pontibacter harenae TaxID=2894083 RepID=UPI001E5B3E99|nr:isoamylase early set domain-containing protein [Pontibacter harenae]MCC9166630.1 isoamylase early set domain-containing protein [Pontibacter harenae]